MKDEFGREESGGRWRPRGWKVETAGAKLKVFLAKSFAWTAETRHPQVVSEIEREVDRTEETLIYSNQFRGKCRFTWLNPRRMPFYLALDFDIFICWQQLTERGCGFEHLNTRLRI